MSARSKIFNRKVLAFLICLLLAFLAWTINKLTKEYTYDLPYTVCIHSTIQTNIRPSCATNIMYVRVTAKGFHIMFNLHKPTELDIDIKRIRLTRSTEEHHAYEYVLPTRLLQAAIKEAIGDAVRMESILTENLYFDIH